MIDPAVIIARGYTLDEEYIEMLHSDKLEKLVLVPFRGKGKTETLWIYRLETGHPFHFIFFNDPYMLLRSQPRGTAGMVGISCENYKDGLPHAHLEECIDLFEQVGEAAIAYAHRTLSA